MGWLRKTKGVNRPGAVEIRVDGRAVTAYPGESAATALFAAGITVFRASPGDQSPRAAFCLMGSCQECAVWIDGRRRLACQYPVQAGTLIETGACPDD